MHKKEPAAKHKVYCKSWREKESKRPHGYSLHLNRCDSIDFGKEFPEDNHEPHGEITEIEVDQHLFDRVQASDWGIRIMRLPGKV